MGRHNAPTNKPCRFVYQQMRCVRYAGHPANLYGTLGHRMRRPQDWAFVCTRADLAGWHPNGASRLS